MAPDAILASDAPVAGKPRPARRSPHGQVRSPLNPISGVALHPAGHGSLPSRRAGWPSAPRRPPALGRVRDRIVGPVERGNTTEPIPLISPASASEPSQDVHTTWLREISRLADGHRRGRPYGRTGSFVIRFPANPDGWTTADDHRNACGHAVGPAVAVRQGVRSRHPADKPGCPSGTAVRAGVRVGVRPSARSGNPTACRAWKVQENKMSGCWRSARRRLAPTTRPWPPTAATSATCCRLLGIWKVPGPNTSGCSRSARQRLAPTTRPWPRYRVTRQPQRRAPGPPRGDS